MLATDVSIPDPAIVLDLIEAFRRSKTMFAAVELGVFDALESPKRMDCQILVKITNGGWHTNPCCTKCLHINFNT